jgi:transcriptional regulator with XRE-family HTH domain
LKGLTLEQLEGLSGISPPYTSKIERGRMLPPPDTFRTLARHVGLAADETQRLLTQMGFARDCAELVRLGYDEALAGVLAAARHAEPGVRQQIVSTVLDRFAPALSVAAASALPR